MSDTLQLETRGNVLLITLNRPEARNAMDFETATAPAAAIDRLEADDTLAPAVLTGAGGTFCSGMDLKGFLAGKRPSLPGAASAADRGTAAQGADRRGGRLCTGRRLRAGARLRPDRGLACSEIRPAGSQARAGRRRRRTDAPAAPRTLPRGNGVRVDR